MSLAVAAAIVGGQVASAVLYFRLTVVTGGLVDALLAGDGAATRRTFLDAFLLCFGSTVLLVMTAFAGEFARLEWRRRVVHRLHELYFQHATVYLVNIVQPCIDNSDQRVTRE